MKDRRHPPYWNYYYALRMRLRIPFGLRYPRQVDAISTQLSVLEKQALYESGRRLGNGKTIVEIGSYYGASANCLAYGIGSRDGKIHAVDTFENTATSDGHANIYDMFCVNTRANKDKIVPHRGWSVQVAHEFAEPIDMLFVDGDHSWNGVLNDMCAWLPKIRSDAVLAMHDVGWGDVSIFFKRFVAPHATKYWCRLSNLYIGQGRWPDLAAQLLATRPRPDGHSENGSRQVYRESGGKSC